MFEEEINGKIIAFVVVVVISLVIGTLFEDTSLGNFLVNISSILLFIGIVAILFYLMIVLFIDMNDRKKELEKQRLKITELEDKLRKKK